MEYQKQNNFYGIKSLIELGVHGHFPLFPQEWFLNFSLKFEEKISKTEKEKAQKIINRLGKHKNLNRKRTILYSLNDEERYIFLKVFFRMVEGRILNNKLELH